MTPTIVWEVPSLSFPLGNPFSPHAVGCWVGRVREWLDSHVEGEWNGGLGRATLQLQGRREAWVRAQGYIPAQQQLLPHVLASQGGMGTDQWSDLGTTWTLFQGRQSVVLGEWLLFLFLKVSLRERDAWGKSPKQWKWNTAFLQSITTWSASTNHTTRSLSKTILCMPSHSHHIPVYLKLSYEIGRIVTATKTQRR